MKLFRYLAYILLSLLLFSGCGNEAFHITSDLTVTYEASGSDDIGVVQINILNASGEIELFSDQTLPWTYEILRPFETPGTGYLCVSKAASEIDPLNSFTMITLTISVEGEVQQTVTRPDETAGINENKATAWNGSPVFIQSNIDQYNDTEAESEETQT